MASQIPLTQCSPAMRPVLHQQKLIGWHQLLEGLPGTYWRKFQHNHWLSTRMRRSSKRWMQGLMLRLLRLGRGQWLHRNDIKHVVKRPRHLEMSRCLQREIMRLYLQGSTTVTPRDQHFFKWNMCFLLTRSLRYKKAWLVNVTTARDFRARFFHPDPEHSLITPSQATLLEWIKTGRAP